MLEYSMLTILVMISTVLYGVTATLSALITRLTLNWARLKNREKSRMDPIQLERLMSSAGEV